MAVEKIIAYELSVDIDEAKKQYDQFIQKQTDVRKEIVKLQVEHKRLKKLQLEALKEAQKGNEDAKHTYRELTQQIVKTEESLSNLKQTQKQTNKDYKGVKEGLTAYQQLTKELSNAKDGLRNLAAEGKKNTTEYKALYQEYNKIEQTLKDINAQFVKQKAVKPVIQKELTAYQKLTKQLNDARKGYKDLAAGNKEATDEAKAFLAVIDKLDPKIKAIDARVGQHQRKVGEYAQAWNGARARMSSFAATLGVGLGLSELNNRVRAGINIFADFQQQIKILGAVSRASKSELSALEADAKRLGETTQFTATQVAELQTIYARRGFKPQQILDATEATTNLSIATGEALGESADLVSGIIKGYGLQASQSGEIADILTKTFNTSAAQLGTFKEANKEIAATARVLKIPFSEIAAAIGVLTDNQLEGTVATNTVETALQRLADPTKKYAKAAADLNIEVFNQKGEFVGLGQLIENITTATAGMTDEQKLATVSQIVGVQAAKNFSVLLNGQKEITEGNTVATYQGAEALNKYAESLENSAGSAKVAADQVGNSLKQDILKLNSAIEGAAIRFGEMNEGGLRDFVQFLTRSVPVLQENAGLILKITAALALYLARQKLLNAAKKEGTIVSLIQNTASKAYAVSLQLLSGQLTKATIKQQIFNAASKLNPYVLIIAGIIALGIALSELYNRNEKVKKGFDQAGRILKGFLNVGKTIIVFVYELGKSFASVSVSILSKSKLLRLGFNLVKAVFVAGSQIITKALSNIPAVADGIEAAVNQMSVNVSSYFEVVKIRSEILMAQLKRIKALASFDNEGVANIDRDIEKLRERKKAVEAESISLKDAFSNAYNASLEASKNSQLGSFFDTDKKATPPGGDSSGDAATGGGSGSGGLSEIKSRADAAKKAAEVSAAAQRKIEDLTISIMQDGTEKKIAQIKLSASREKAEIEAVGAERTTLEKLIEQQAASEIKEVKESAAEAEKNLRLQKRTDLITALDEDAEREKVYLQEKLVNSLITEKEYNAQLLTVQIDAITQKKALYEAGSIEFVRLEQQEHEAILSARKTANETSIQVENERYERRKILAEQQMLKQLSVVDLSESEQVRIKNEYNEKILDIERERLVRQLETVQAGSVQYLDLQRNISNLDYQIFNSNEEKKRASAEETQRKRVELLEQSANVANDIAGVVSTNYEANKNNELYIITEREKAYAAAKEKELEAAKGNDEKKKEIEERYNQRQSANAAIKEQIEKKYAEKQQKIAIVQALIDGAKGIVRTGANMGYPAAIPFQILQGAQTLAQIKLMKSKKFAKGTVLKGNTHNEGGIDIYSNDGQYFGEAENNEIIQTKGVYENPRSRAVASFINEAAGGIGFGGSILPNELKSGLRSFIGNNPFKTTIKTAPSYRPKFATGTILQASDNQRGVSVSVDMSDLTEMLEQYANRPTIVDVNDINSVNKDKNTIANETIAL